MYGGELGLRTGQTLASRDQRLRAELGRGGLEVDRDRLALAEEELYGGVGQRDYRGTTLSSREADRAAGFERERIDLAGEAGQREAFRNQLAEQAQYGYRTDEAGVREDTLANIIATREQADRTTALGYDSRRIAEAERSGRAQRSLQRRELDWRQEQQATDNALRAIGLVQTTGENYVASDEEQAIMQRLLAGAVVNPNTGGFGHPGGPPIQEDSGYGLEDEFSAVGDPYAAEPLTEEEVWFKRDARARDRPPWTPRDDKARDADGNIIHNPFGLTYSG